MADWPDSPLFLLLQMIYTCKQEALVAINMASKSPERERQRAKVRVQEVTFASPIFWLHSDLVSRVAGSEGNSEQLSSHLVLICPWADRVTLTQLPGPGVLKIKFVNSQQIHCYFK